VENRIILETERLLLRELTHNDLEFLTEMLAHPEVMRYWPRPYTPKEAVEWIDRHRERYRTHGYGYWLAIEKANRQPVGQAGVLMQEVGGVEETGIGYMLHRPFWGQGFATEAARGCLHYAFETLGRDRVVVLIRPENTSSLRVAQRLNVRLEKSTHYAGFEHHVFVLHRGEAEQEE
jgi:ribosomal-protein-alanine N-acetyltransferase